MKNQAFFAMLSRMKYIARWGLMRNNMREDLSQHSFDTAVIAHALATIGNSYFGKNVDAGEISAAALFHDVPEILIGDLPTPVKYNNPSILQAFKHVEQEAGESLLTMLPEPLRPTYRDLFNFDRQKPELYAYIKAADKICAYIKCTEEIKSGNDEFKQAAEQIKTAIASIDMPEVSYFMEHFAPAYALTLDELQQ